MVLYVGEKPLNMPDRLKSETFSFEYHIVDIRSFDGNALLDSSEISDNVLAVLARLDDQRAALKRIIANFKSCDERERSAYLQALFILAGLRGIEDLVEEEAKNMPITVDILENKVLGREYKRGRHEGELGLLRGQLEYRFGPLPEWASEFLAKRSTAELESLSKRLLDSTSLEDLLR